MRKHKINVQNAYKEGKGQALVESTNNFEEWVLDSGATHHMGA